MNTIYKSVSLTIQFFFLLIAICLVGTEAYGQQLTGLTYNYQVQSVGGYYKGNGDSPGHEEPVWLVSACHDDDDLLTTLITAWSSTPSPQCGQILCEFDADDYFDGKFYRWSSDVTNSSIGKNLLNVNDVSDTKYDYHWRFWESDQNPKCTRGSHDHPYDHQTLRNVQNQQPEANKWSSEIDLTLGPASTYEVYTSIKTAWRYNKGNKNTPIPFGVVNGSKYHINTNREAPEGADANIGYDNDWTNTSSPDVTYTFEIAQPGKRVTISTDYDYTDFDTHLYLYDGTDLLANDDDSGTEGDGAASGKTSRISIDLCPGIYTVVVEGRTISETYTPPGLCWDPMTQQYILCDPITITYDEGDFRLNISTADIVTTPGTIVAENQSVCKNEAIGAINSSSLATAGDIDAADISYKWFKSENNGSYGEIVGATGAQLTSAQAENMPASTTEQNIVRIRRHAYACGGIEAISNIVTITAQATPSIPAIVSVDADNTNNEIVLTWNDNSTNETEFEIWRSFEGTNSQLVLIPRDATESSSTGNVVYRDNAAGLCKDYTYTIRANNECGNSSDFTESSLPVKLGPNIADAFSSAGGSFNGSKGYFTDRVQLTWTTEDDNVIEDYRILRKPLGFTGAFVLLQEVSGGGIYQDLISDAGIFYEYAIVGIASCGADQIETDTAKTIGFRSKSGIINGNVAYAGGIDVANVKIKADPDLIATGTSLEVNGCSLSIPHNASTQEIGGNLLLETWIKPKSYTNPFTVISKAGAYELTCDGSNYIFKVYYNGSSSDQITIPASKIPINNWKSLQAQVKSDSLFLYVDGEEESSVMLSSAANINDPSVPINIGNNLDGYLKEMRIWKVEKSKLLVERLSERYVTNAENGLILLLPMTEGNGGFAYDRSRKSLSEFNNNHAKFSSGCANNVAWVTESPNQNQLSYIAYTNINGSYTLNLPYTNSGEAYTLTPSFPAHTFNPTDPTLFVGNSSTVINGVDFIDESAFLVSGFVKYKDHLDCPVPDAFLKVDGEIVIRFGEPVKTDENGEYIMSVPIGKHFISVEKAGHVFNNGRTDVIDFQKAETFDFEDSTLVRIVGRVVGGTIEGSKKPGLGFSKNNIGQANLTFEASDGCLTDMTTTNENTGEYDIALPPLRFNPTVDMVNGPDIDFANPKGSNLDQINLVNPLQPMTVSDTLFDAIGQVLNIDSVSFEKRIDYINRVDPQIVVTHGDGVRPFIGDTLYTYVNPIDNSTTERNLWDNPMRWPVFANVDDDYVYRCLIKVYEEYVNADNMEVDSVPTVDGTLLFENELSNEPVVSVKLADFNNPDTLKALIYSFQLGVSNLLYNDNIPDYSYTRKFGISLKKANGQIIPWSSLSQALLPGITNPMGGDGVYRGYILAARTDGEQFVTNGPDRPEFILRDPPGSGSYAQRDIGSTTTKSESWAWDAGGSAFTNDKITAGADFTAGIGVQIQNKIDIVTDIGFKAEISGGRNGSLDKTLTNTESWTTNSAAIKVGTASDLFIGTSQNVQFGITEILAFVPESLCGVEVTCIDSMNYQGIPFRPAILSGLSLVPGEYETGFIYSQDHIKNVVLPQLLELRNIALMPGGKYTNVLPVSDINFGKNNDDPAFLNAVTTGPNPGFETLSGPSYTYNAVDLEDSLTGDIVRHFNNQMALWEETLRLNEWEKVNIDNQTVIDSLKDIEIAAIEEEYLPYKAAFLALSAFEAGGGIPIAYGIIANPLPGTAAGGFATFAVTSAVSIANSEIAQHYIEYKFKLEQIEDRFGDTVPKNKSFSSGASYSSSITQSLASSIENSFEYTLSADLKLTIEGLINNNGVGLEKGLGLSFKNSRKWGQATEETETISYTLSDDNNGDFYSVDIYPSLFGWGPIFKRRPGGLTSCPYEGEEVTEFYQPGTLIHPPTQQVDAPTISVSTCCLSGIPADQPAVFNLTLGNEGASNLSRTYEVALVSASNPFGAIVRIDGSASNTVIIPAGGSINKVLTIEKGAGSTFEYTDLEIIIYPECDRTLGQSRFLSASFIPICTPVTLGNPDDLWVLNNHFNDSMSIRIQDYNYNTFGLNQFIFEMKSADEPNFTPIRRFYRDTLPEGVLTADADSFTNSTAYIDYDWLVDMVDDGTYDLRITSLCKVLGEDIVEHSEIHRGYMDRINPRAFGTPSPGDGILDPDDDIILTMNETVDIGSITDRNFEVFGRINGATMGPGTEHKASVAFDGINSSAEIPEYQLQNRSMTIEFWVKRNGQSNEVVLSQGLSSGDELLVFFEDQQLKFKLGDNTFASEDPIPADEWHHCAIIYNRDNNECTIFIVGAGPSDTFDKTGTFLTDYTSTGLIGVGKHMAGGLPLFDGNIHGLRLWSTPKTTSQINSGRAKVFSGREAGLIGYWSMDDAQGTIAKDIVRSRHMSLSGSTWSILPPNHSYNFDENQEYLEVTNSGSLVFKEETDVTFEAWIKAGSTGKQSILSTGNPNATTFRTWDIYYNGGSNELVIANDDMLLATPMPSMFSGQWHHFAIVIERSRSVSIYVDGNLINTGTASDFSGFQGAKLWVGCRGWIDNFEIEHRDQFFDGKIDELRIWSSARKPEQIARDRVFQLEGNEFGLEVYYPFDDIILDDNNRPTRVATLEDVVVDSLSLASGTGFDLHLGQSVTESFSEEDAPTVKLPRIRERLRFDYVINDDQIFIDIQNDPKEIENVTIDITVKDLKDLAGNIMQSDETWIAYVNKNQVFWETEYFNLEKDINDPLSFTAKIKNTGGSQEIFSISNLPSWLSASTTGGIIGPNSSIEVTFTVLGGINIGEYEQDIFVTTDFGFNERLLFDLKVTAEPPVWEIDANAYDYSMNLIGELRINDVISTDDEDMVSVWINDELRGVSHVEKDPVSGKYLVFLTISSDTTLQEDLEFRAWDASLGRLLVGIQPDNFKFQDNTIVGSPSAPQPITATVLTQLTYYLKAGWNWISYPLGDDILADVNATLKDLSPTVGDEVGAWNRFDRFKETGIWEGSLDAQGFNTNEGYKIYVEEPDTFRYEGLFYNPAEDPIIIEPKWNWIGMKSEVNLDLNTALSSLNPTQGDVIKGQQRFAIYDELFGWSGNLDFLTPKVGYMYKSSTPQSLIYPGSGLPLPPSNARNLANLKSKPKHPFVKKVEAEVRTYSSNMSLTAAISECFLAELSGKDIDLSEWMLSAHVGDENRGITNSIWVGQSKQHLFYLTIAGDGASDLEFRLVKNDGSDEIQLNQGFTFATNDVKGVPSSPYLFICGDRIQCVDDRIFNSADINLTESLNLYKARYGITTDASIPTGIILQFRAGRKVELFKGFQATKGARLEVFIDDCEEVKE